MKVTFYKALNGEYGILYSSKKEITNEYNYTKLLEKDISTSLYKLLDRMSIEDVNTYVKDELNNIINSYPEELIF